MNYNFTELIAKEKEKKYKKLINQSNNYGIIKNYYDDYKIKSYIDLMNYNETPVPILQLNDFDIYIAVTRIPTIALSDNNTSINIEIEKGDLLYHDDKWLEVGTSREIIEKGKSYFSSSLAPVKSLTPYNQVEEELYKTFFILFEKLGIEAIRHDKFFQNRYFKDRDMPFLLYSFKEVEMLNNYTSRTDQLRSGINVKYLNRTKRKYNLLIRLYDRGKILDLDVILSKRRIFEINYDYLDSTNIKHVFVKSLNHLSNEDVFLNESIINEKMYSIELFIETHYVYEIDNIERAILKGELK